MKPRYQHEQRRDAPNPLETWKPKTALGKQVQTGAITDIDAILDSGQPILEAEIVDTLLPNMASDLLGIGQSKGKFGGGKRTIWRQTQKKTSEGNKPKFSALCVIGNKNGYVGIGFGKAKETVPAREKSVRKSKINIMKIRRGCGSWECGCGKPHSIPFKIIGKCGSVIMHLIPAPRGTGLCVEQECGKILAFAGIKDIYAQTFGQTRTKMNVIGACVDALKKLSAMKVQPDSIISSGLTEGKI